MQYEPSVAWMWGALYACYGGSYMPAMCYLFTKNGWEEGPDLIMWRRVGVSSVVTSRGLLIIGGDQESRETTEVVSQTGSRSSFPLSSKMQHHCVIKTSSSSAVLTGGSYTLKQALEYTGLDGPDSGVTSTDLPDLNTGRKAHGCGAYEHHGALVGFFSGVIPYFLYLDADCCWRCRGE